MNALTCISLNKSRGDALMRVTLVAHMYTMIVVNGAAPTESVRNASLPSLNNYPICKGRRRKRGPRSVEAIKRRSHKRCSVAPAGTAIGESMADVPASPIVLQPFIIYSINIQCLKAHGDELTHYLDLHAPHLVCIQETWLDESVKNVPIVNYQELARKDRSPDANRGGIITYIRSDVHNVVHLSMSAVAERMIHLVHTDTGILAVVNWYRPPKSDLSHVTSLPEEMPSIEDGIIGVIVLGDLNLHHTSWLRYSNSITHEAELLKSIADELSLLQLVKEPTRGKYLLDLVLSDLNDLIVQVLPSIADHKALLVKTLASAPKLRTFERDVWHFKGAAWNNLRCVLRNTDWTFLKYGDVNQAVNSFMEILWSYCIQYIPRGTRVQKISTHPWINDDCRHAISVKAMAEGSDDYVAARDACSRQLQESYKAYHSKLKEQIRALPKSDKRWWSLNRELLNRKAKVSSIPPLKSEDGIWILDSKSKADHFAEGFISKSTLPPMPEDQFLAAPTQLQDSFVAIRCRHVLKLLLSLDLSKATGPDQISARILKELAHELSLPLTVICRRILQEATWPERWKLQHIIPLYKRKSVYNRDNYRGVHLTSIMSKVVEKTIGNPLISHLQQHGFGKSQWGFRKRCSSRDLVLASVARWILSICKGKKIGLYLGDITGAFDKVFKDYLIAKLHSCGVSD